MDSANIAELHIAQEEVLAGLRARIDALQAHPAPQAQASVEQTHPSLVQVCGFHQGIIKAQSSFVWLGDAQYLARIQFAAAALSSCIAREDVKWPLRAGWATSSPCIAAEALAPTLSIKPPQPLPPGSPSLHPMGTLSGLVGATVL